MNRTAKIPSINPHCGFVEKRLSWLQILNRASKVFMSLKYIRTGHSPSIGSLR